MSAYPYTWMVWCLFPLSHGALTVVYRRIHCVTQIDADCMCCETCLEKVANKLCDPLIRTSLVHTGEKIWNNMDYIKVNDHNYVTKFSAFKSAAKFFKRLKSVRNLASRATVFQWMPTDGAHGVYLFSSSHHELPHSHCVVVFLKDSRTYANTDL